MTSTLSHISKSWYAMPTAQPTGLGLALDIVRGFENSNSWGVLCEGWDD
jgi:hypothetical protein